MMVRSLMIGLGVSLILLPEPFTTAAGVALLAACHRRTPPEPVPLAMATRQYRWRYQPTGYALYESLTRPPRVARGRLVIPSWAPARRSGTAKARARTHDDRPPVATAAYHRLGTEAVTWRACCEAANGDASLRALKRYYHERYGPFEWGAAARARNGTVLARTERPRATRESREGAAAPRASMVVFAPTRSRLNVPHKLHASIAAWRAQAPADRVLAVRPR